MSVSISPLARFGSEVHSLDAERLSSEDGAALRQALAEGGILIARGLTLSPTDHVALTRVFGEPELHPIEELRLPGVPELIEFETDLTGTLDTDDPSADDVVGAIEWHSDLSYTSMPSRGALLYAVDVPDRGGDTGFVDTARVYAALPAGLRRRIAGLEVVHQFSRAMSRSSFLPAVTHPLVHRHPLTGQPVLNVSPMFTRSIVGLSAEAGRALLDELIAFATQERFAYLHRWTKGDLVVWDNWKTMHTATGHPKRFRRRVLRSTIRGATRLAAAW
jgi:taurine dioxygenase